MMPTSIKPNPSNIVDSIIATILVTSVLATATVVGAHEYFQFVPAFVFEFIKSYWSHSFSILFLISYIIKSVQYRLLKKEDIFYKHFDNKKGIAWVKSLDDENFKQYMFLYWFIENKTQTTEKYTYNYIYNKGKFHNFPSVTKYNQLIKNNILSHESRDALMEYFSVRINPEVYKFLENIRKDMYKKFKYYNSFIEYCNSQGSGLDSPYLDTLRMSYNMLENKIDTIRNSEFHALVTKYLKPD